MRFTSRGFRICLQGHGHQEWHVANYQLDSLVPMAEELDLCMRYNHQIGEFINEGAILCHVWDAKIREDDRSLKGRIKEHKTFGIPKTSSGV